MGAGHNLDMFGQVTVPSDRPVMGAVQPHQLGQHVRITRVALGPRHPVPFPIPSGLQRVHRKHRVSGGHQRLHPRTPISFNPHRHISRLGVIGQVIGDQRVRLRHTGDTLRKPLLTQPPPGLIDHLDIVVILGPVISNEQHLGVLLTPAGT